MATATLVPISDVQFGAPFTSTGANAWSVLSDGSDSTFVTDTNDNGVELIVNLTQLVVPAGKIVTQVATSVRGQSISVGGITFPCSFGGSTFTDSPSPSFTTTLSTQTNVDTTPAEVRLTAGTYSPTFNASSGASGLSGKIMDVSVVVTHEWITDGDVPVGF